MEKIGGTGSVLSDYYSDATRRGRQIKFAKLPLDYSAIPPIPFLSLRLLNALD
jgi:hypothetical protein